MLLLARISFSMQNTTYYKRAGHTALLPGVLLRARVCERAREPLIAPHPQQQEKKRTTARHFSLLNDEEISRNGFLLLLHAAQLIILTLFFYTRFLAAYVCTAQCLYHPPLPATESRLLSGGCWHKIASSAVLVKNKERETGRGSFLVKHAQRVALGLMAYKCRAITAQVLQYLPQFWLSSIQLSQAINLPQLTLSLLLVPASVTALDTKGYTHIRC